MSTARRLAVSYSRFSDPKQAKGDSETRQDQLFRDFCIRKNLTPLGEIFADRGRSGYKDEHRKKGRLGHLIEHAKDGRFEPGTVIVVEAWDRLGRLRPDRQTDLVAELLRTGVSIGVCRLDDIFCEDDFGSHKWTTLAVFIQLAFQESKQKAERVAASWQRRRERARSDGEPLGCRLPAWIESVNGEVRIIPEHAAVVKRIFEMAAAGNGHTRIVKALDAEKVPPFGSLTVQEGRLRSQFSGRWTRPYIALILRDRRAMGEFQPCKDDKPDGAPLAGFFPAVVTEDTFLLARAGQEQRQNGRTPSQRKYVNLFRGMLTHARDGEGFTLHNKGTAAAPQLILVNAKGEGGRDKCYTFPYPIFETAVLACLREVDPRDVLPTEKIEPSRANVLRGALASVRERIAAYREEMKAGFSKAVIAVVRDLEIEEERIGLELQEELARSVKPTERAWAEFPTLADLIKSAPDQNEVRLKLRPVLRKLIESAWVLIVPRGSYRLVALQIDFTGGGRRTYLIYHQTAGYRRSGSWEVRSFADVVVGRGDLDLRKKKDAAKLATLLESIDPNDL